jgi:hypothetical protein
MNKLVTIIKKWVDSHSLHPEAISEKDWNLMSGAFDFLGTNISLLIAFAIYSAIYFWIYKKYGFDKTIILLCIGIIITISNSMAQLKKSLVG